MFNERIAVVDCAYGRTIFGVFSTAGGRLQLLDYAAIAHREATAAEAMWVTETKSAFQKIRTRSAGLPVVLVLPATLTLNKYVRLPAVDATKRDKILRFEAAQGIPLPLGEVVWDAVVTDASGTPTEAAIYAAKRQTVEALCAAAEESGLLIKQLLPATPCLEAAAKLAGLHPDAPQAFINAHEGSTVVAVRQDGVTRARSGATGQATDATPAEHAARLAAELTRTIAHFQKLGAVESPREIQLTGALAGVSGVTEELTRRLNISVQIFDALRGVEVAREAAAAGAPRDAFRLAELIGAAALVSADKPVPNLLPPRLRATEEQRRRRPWWAVAAALLMLAPLPPYLHYRSARIATEEKIAAIEAEVAPLRERTARIRQLTEELAVAQGTERRLRELHERRDAWVGLMADLQGRLGRVEDAWFDSMKIAPATGPGEVGWRISVTGRLLDRTNPRTAVSRDASMRVRALLADINASPFVSVAGEKFNDAQPGILQFNFTLVPKTARPL